MMPTEGRPSGWTIAGIEVRVNPSVLIIVGLLTLSLATAMFPAQAPGFSPAAYWAAGGLAAVGLLASILAHELAHAVVAKRYGIDVGSITLWLFGGVAQLESEAPSPKAEALIAGVGPALSIAVGLVAGAIAFGLRAVDSASLLVAAVGWLALINIILGVFNLLPGIPLDGGRLLHAILWGRSNDRVRASERASAAGRVIGWILVGIGFFQAVVGANLGGLWTALIGWFIVNAATAEGRSTVARDALQGLVTSRIMTSPAVSVPEWVTLRALVDGYVLDSQHSAFPAVDLDGRLSGLVSLAEIRRVSTDRWDDVRVRDVMVAGGDVVTAGPDTPVMEVLERLSVRGGRRAVVVHDGEPVGIVSSTDIVRAIERGTLARRT